MDTENKTTENEYDNLPLIAQPAYPQNPEPKVIEKPQRSVIETDSRGVLAPKDFESTYRLVKAYVASGLLPKQFNTPEKALVAYQFCLELNLKPLTSMRYIAFINGSLYTFGVLPLSLVLASGKCEYVDEWLFDIEGKKMCLENNNLNAELGGAVCITKRKGSPHALHTTFTVAQAKTAGIWGTNVWKLYKETMIKMRARTFNLKDNFADILGGILIAEHDANFLPDKIEDNSAPIDTGRAADLNKLIDGYEANRFSYDK